MIGPDKRKAIVTLHEEGMSLREISRRLTYRKKRSLALQSFSTKTSAAKDEPSSRLKKRAALRRNWARLIKRVYQVEPLKCDFGRTFRVVAFITEHKVITKILQHLEKTKIRAESRAPPESRLPIPQHRMFIPSVIINPNAAKTVGFAQYLRALSVLPALPAPNGLSSGSTE